MRGDLIIVVQGTQCKNEGICRPACDSPPGYTCDCGEGWEGLHCHLKVKSGRASFLYQHQVDVSGNIMLMSQSNQFNVDVSVDTLECLVNTIESSILS